MIATGRGPFSGVFRYDGGWGVGWACGLSSEESGFLRRRAEFVGLSIEAGKGRKYAGDTVFPRRGVRDRDLRGCYVRQVHEVMRKKSSCPSTCRALRAAAAWLSSRRRAMTTRKADLCGASLSGPYLGRLGKLRRGVDWVSGCIGRV